MSASSQTEGVFRFIRLIPVPLLVVPGAVVLSPSTQLLYSPQNQPICIPYRFYVRQTHPTKTIIARIWLVLGVVAVFRIALPYFGQTSAHRYYYMMAVEYDTKIKIYDHMEHEEVIQSFVEGDDTDAYTYLGMLYIGIWPNTDYGLFNPWASSVGVSQIQLSYSPSAQTRLTQSELGQLVLSEADLNLNSPDPLWEFEKMQSSGFLKFIANNPTPITKFHPANIATDLLILIFIAGAFWSTAYLIKRRYLKAKIDETARCPTCNYPRTGLASITQCPECGHHFTIRTSDNAH